MTKSISKFECSLFPKESSVHLGSLSADELEQMLLEKRAFPDAEAAKQMLGKAFLHATSAGSPENLVRMGKGIAAIDPRMVGGGAALGAIGGGLYGAMKSPKTDEQGRPIDSRLGNIARGAVGGAALGGAAGLAVRPAAVGLASMNNPPQIPGVYPAERPTTLSGRVGSSIRDAMRSAIDPNDPKANAKARSVEALEAAAGRLHGSTRLHKIDRLRSAMGKGPGVRPARRGAPAAASSTAGSSASSQDLGPMPSPGPEAPSASSGVPSSIPLSSFPPGNPAETPVSGLSPYIPSEVPVQGMSPYMPSSVPVSELSPYMPSEVPVDVRGAPRDVSFGPKATPRDISFGPTLAQGQSPRDVSFGPSAASSQDISPKELQTLISNMEANKAPPLTPSAIGEGDSLPPMPPPGEEIPNWQDQVQPQWDPQAKTIPEGKARGPRAKSPTLPSSVPVSSMSPYMPSEVPIDLRGAPRDVSFGPTSSTGKTPTVSAPGTNYPSSVPVSNLSPYMPSQIPVSSIPSTARGMPSKIPSQDDLGALPPPGSEPATPESPYIPPSPMSGVDLPELGPITAPIGPKNPEYRAPGLERMVLPSELAKLRALKRIPVSQVSENNPLLPDDLANLVFQMRNPGGGG